MALATGWPPSVILSQDYTVMHRIMKIKRELKQEHDEEIAEMRKQAEFDREIKKERRERGM